MLDFGSHTFLKRICLFVCEAFLCCLPTGGTETSIARGNEGDGPGNSSQEQHALMAPSGCNYAFWLHHLSKMVMLVLLQPSE